MKAAKRARRQMQTLQLYFGVPSWFLTVIPDGEFNVLLQAYAYDDFDKGAPQ